MKNIGIMPKLNRIERKCDLILGRIPCRTNENMDALIRKMSTAASELERISKPDIRK